MATTNTDQYTPRQMLAAIALTTELPVPKNISFHPNGTLVSLVFRDMADGFVWSAHLGGKTDIRVYDDTRYLDEGAIRWHGWAINLLATESVNPPAEALGPDVADQLTGLIEGDTADEQRDNAAARYDADET